MSKAYKYVNFADAILSVSFSTLHQFFSYGKATVTCYLVSNLTSALFGGQFVVVKLQGPAVVLTRKRKSLKHGSTKDFYSVSLCFFICSILIGCSKVTHNSNLLFTIQSLFGMFFLFTAVRASVRYLHGKAGKIRLKYEFAQPQIHENL